MAENKQTSAKKPDPRRLALDVLLRMDTAADDDGETASGGYSNLLIGAAIRRSGIDAFPADRALLTLLVNGVTERRITLDALIARLSSRPLDSLDPDVLNILRLGIFQLRYADRIPAHAAIHETVALAKPSGRGFVNAVLRSYQRAGEIPLGAGKNVFRDMAVTYSVPRELCRRLCEIYGEETARRVCEASHAAPGLTLRVNTLRTSREALLLRLRDEGFDGVPTPYSPFGIRLISGSGIPGAVMDGSAFVQDESSQLCALALGAAPGCSLLDVCACPGSKSFSAALMMENRGRITACDLHASKLPLITAEAEKLGITIISPVCRDSSLADPTFREQFDRVLCDVPCSGFGVMAKKPEIRYRSLADAAALPALQYRILCASAEAVRPGGVLVYSTCTILPEENEQNAERFLAERSDFAPLPFDFPSSDGSGTLRAPNGRLTLLPTDGYQGDGFFISRFIKKDQI